MAAAFLGLLPFFLALGKKTNYNGRKIRSGQGRKKRMNKILLLEDDLSLVNGLTFAFHKQGLT